MKTELINIMQIVFVLMLLVGVITYAFTVYKNQIRNFNSNLIKKIYIMFLDFSRHMIIKNYVSFEKYDIWRYCVHF
ncbi:hypothetical protein NNC19_10830 [Clostridium sp. SHJSY1]|uniref:hypothetical protein n=1 Tax=Clostridium sp. SHJSY1 TaxID=2942483 RepID=UPI0028744462|nr:hypothetical protein [Clostridium sp. SHJSY1]MDS0526176.1 hypothetical protein [Clostridium sp. SHJSY1]